MSLIQISSDTVELKIREGSCASQADCRLSTERESFGLGSVDTQVEPPIGSGRNLTRR